MRCALAFGRILHRVCSFRHTDTSFAPPAARSRFRLGTLPHGILRTLCHGSVGQSSVHVCPFSGRSLVENTPAHCQCA
eukprot:6770125-Pyramimonas_sp.AAC.1